MSTAVPLSLMSRVVFDSCTLAAQHLGYTTMIANKHDSSFRQADMLTSLQPQIQVPILPRPFAGPAPRGTHSSPGCSLLCCLVDVLCAVASCEAGQKTWFSLLCTPFDWFSGPICAPPPSSSLKLPSSLGPALFAYAIFIGRRQSPTA